ncbi:hypothetical protein FOCC_FOCC005180 [Frankliniella occidentalis]|nr:hypothetical protein FOCC_FOCC005180 [Frankliniella occidentalis]
MTDMQSLLAQRVTEDLKGGPRPDSTAAHLSPSHLQPHVRPPSSTGSSVQDDPHYRHLGASSDASAAEQAMRQLLHMQQLHQQHLQLLQQQHQQQQQDDSDSGSCSGSGADSRTVRERSRSRERDADRDRADRDRADRDRADRDRERDRDAEEKGGADCPTPNVSVGPPPPLLPYLYPPSLYPGAAAFQGPPLSLFGAAGHGVNPSLLLNAQLALAAQQFGHYPHLGQPAGSLNQHLKAAMAGVAGGLSGGHPNRFSPYPLTPPGAGAGSPLSPSRMGPSPLGSAFEAVTPGSSLLARPPSGSPSSPPPGYPHLHHNHPAFPGARDLLHHHPARRSPSDSRSRSTSPSSRTSPTSAPQPPRRSPSPTSLEVVRLNSASTTPTAAQTVSTTSSSPSSQIRSIERMVNGLDGTPRGKAGSSPNSPGTTS